MDESLKNDLRKSKGEEEKINNKIKTIDGKIEEGKKCEKMILYLNILKSISFKRFNLRFY